VEVHADEDSRIDPLAEAKRLLTKRKLLGAADAQKIDAAVKEARGFPVDVSIDQS
jgi:TPP-dependent pyruvate/acetoin dehydrogenase alpha subunit